MLDMRQHIGPNCLVSHARNSAPIALKAES
jgi:hypothetical protein